MIFGIAEKFCLTHVLIRSWKPVRELYVCGIAQPCLIGDQLWCVCVCVCLRERLKTFCSFSHPPFTVESYRSSPYSPSVLAWNCSLPWKTFYLSVNSHFFPPHWSSRAKVRHFIPLCPAASKFADDLVRLFINASLDREVTLFSTRWFLGCRCCHLLLTPVLLSI